MSNVVGFPIPKAMEEMMADSQLRSDIRQQCAAVVGIMQGHPSDDDLERAMRQLQLASVNLLCMKVTRLLK